ncbi:unnamed protein product [Caenorhabditis angaria]|uniref:Molybdopterin synthase catalytic subunit n=1 Tax=Caenorhabditis angaria TaxID=860376 RepID=A0A9P1I3H9_9PELO|nr:unnamed protein product [Caenorhabditis angaria]
MSENVIAICGCTNSGKTTIAQVIKETLNDCFVINQDDFYFLPENVDKIQTDHTERGFYWSYDEKEALDYTNLKAHIDKAMISNKNVIIEGNMISEFPEIIDLCTKVIVMSLDFKTCKERREKRVYDPPDDTGYFENVAWPAYLRHLKRAYELGRQNIRFNFIDCSEFKDSLEINIQKIISQIDNDIVRISANPLSISDAQKLATSPSSGAISLFVGTTRDNFENKTVSQLSYDCYDSMAYKELRKLCEDIRRTIPIIEKIVIFHRIGIVPVTEASVIIATCSPHRSEAIRATEKAINMLKETIPIWKKEVYNNNSDSCWKSNK